MQHQLQMQEEVDHRYVWKFLEFSVYLRKTIQVELNNYPWNQSKA